MREMLRRAEQLFRRDKQNEKQGERQQMIAQLRAQMEAIVERMEAGDFSEENRYEDLMNRVNALRFAERDESEHPVSEEWTRLMQALREFPHDRHRPPKPANLRLIIDAMERVEAENHASKDGEQAAR